MRSRLTTDSREQIEATVKKLAVVATHPIQYQAPLWRLLAQEPELDVHVFYGSDFSVRGYHDVGFGVTVKWDVPLTDGYAHTFLSCDTGLTGTDGFFAMRATGLARRLRDFGPDAVLIGAYTPFFYWEVVSIVRSLGIPVFIRAETTDAARSRNAVKELLRTMLLRLFYRRCAYFLAIGQNSREHYVRMGIPLDRIGWSPYCVDSHLLERQVMEYLPQRVALRRKLGFTDEQTVFIYSGKLTARKDPLTLARALQAIPGREREQIGLIVLGDGELRSSFQAACSTALESRTVFAGFVNQSQIGRYYAAADCLVLPSAWGETWGLVVNEALQFGLPAVVSDRVGCHRDLIVPEETGFVFPTGDAGELCRRMLDAKALASRSRSVVAEECRQQVSHYSLDEAAQGIRAAMIRA